jgi:hypothetical protein
VRWSDIPTDPTPRTLRQFAALWLGLLGTMALWQWLARDRQALAALLAVLAIGVGSIGLVSPERVRLVYVGLIVATFPIGWVVSQLVLLVVFSLVFTPVSLVFRLIGRDVLGRGWVRDRASYWTPKPAPASVRDYFRQF